MFDVDDDALELRLISCVGSDARRIADFYGSVLGLRSAEPFGGAPLFRVQTADTGSGGALLAFAIAAGRGRPGGGRVGSFSLAVPVDSLAWWRKRLVARGVRILGRAWSFGDECLCFVDPDGMVIFLAEDASCDAGPSRNDPQQGTIGGVHSIELDSFEPAGTAALLVGVMGFVAGPTDGTASRFLKGTLALDVLPTKRSHKGTGGPGTVDRLHWNVPDRHALKRLRMRMDGCPGVEIAGPEGADATVFQDAGGIRFAFGIGTSQGRL